MSAFRSRTLKPSLSCRGLDAKWFERPRFKWAWGFSFGMILAGQKENQSQTGESCGTALQVLDFTRHGIGHVAKVVRGIAPGYGGVKFFLFDK